MCGMVFLFLMCLHIRKFKYVLPIKLSFINKSERYLYNWQISKDFQSFKYRKSLLFEPQLTTLNKLKSSYFWKFIAGLFGSWNLIAPKDSFSLNWIPLYVNHQLIKNGQSPSTLTTMLSARGTRALIHLAFYHHHRHHHGPFSSNSLFCVLLSAS